MAMPSVETRPQCRDRKPFPVYSDNTNLHNWAGGDVKAVQHAGGA